TPVPVVKSAPAAIVEIAEPRVLEPPTVAPQALTGDDFRELQRRLRDIGFDPGPVDGIVGARTKVAYVRLNTACSAFAPLLENLNLPVAGGQSSVEKPAGDKLPDREETKKIQIQLRRAGFDSGPADGIFGSRTQSALRQFQSGCLMAKKFEVILHDSSLPVVTERAASPAPKVSTSSSRSDAGDGLTRSDGTRQGTVVQLVRTSEEIRILQLRLRDEGFDPGPFDGVMGPKTRAALARYEASQRGKKANPSLTTSDVIRRY
ncbi:MAG: peptidoglycan-binding domain-containing protein, partial [Candidatus Binatia bacterium]